MKSKAQKRDEAIERNKKYRDNYILEARNKGMSEEAVQKFADIKQGVGICKNTGYKY
jgi:hypothetical protein